MLVVKLSCLALFKIFPTFLTHVLLLSNTLIALQIVNLVVSSTIGPTKIPKSSRGVIKRIAKLSF